MTDHDLRKHLGRCLVRLSGPGIRGGSGFFVAPGHVLTCAHVVGGRAGHHVTVHSGGSQADGLVLWAEPHGKPGCPVTPYPDLAVVRVDLDGPSAWLDERAPDDGADLFAVGHARVYAPDTERRSASLTMSGWVDSGDSTLLRVSGDELPEGMSGGPVLDLDTGRVCGVVKTARAVNAPHGGVVVPISATRRLPPDLLDQIWRAHDCHHAAAGVWPGLVEQRTGQAGDAVLRPGELSELLGLLTEIPEAAALHEVYQSASGRGLPKPALPLRGRRDVVHALDDLGSRRGELHPVLAFAMTTAVRTARPYPAGELRRWALRVATRLGQRPELDEYQPPGRRLATEEPMAVIAKVVPSAHDRNRFLLEVWLYRRPGDAENFHAGDSPLPLPQTWDALRKLLPEALNQLDGGPDVLVELVLPIAQLNEAVDTWQIWPNRRFARLGRRHPVVVRALDEDEDTQIRSAGDTRWRWLAAQDAVPWHWIDCEDDRDQETLHAWFEESVERAALALPGPPDVARAREVLEVGLFTGLRLAVWRRAPCADHMTGDPHTGGPCAGERFWLNLTAKLAGSDLAVLPRVIKELRNAAAQQPDREHPGHDVVLLWDLGRRPGTSQPLVPLA